MIAEDLSEVGRAGDDVLAPIQLRPDAIAPADRRHAGDPVERQRRPVRGSRKLTWNAGPVGAELRKIDAFAHRILVLEHLQERHAHVQDRRGVERVRVADDRLFGDNAGLPLALRAEPPGVVGEALCLPVAISPEQGVVVGEAMVHTTVELVVDATNRLLHNVVVHQSRPVRERIRLLEQLYRHRIQPPRADDVHHAVALELRISRLALIVDGRQSLR